MLLRFLNLPAVRFLRIAQSLLALCIFFYAGLMPFSPNDLPMLPPTFLHIFGNFCLICSLWLALFHRVALKYLIITAVLISFGCEWTQSFTNSRHTNLWDFFCNFLGIGLGAATCALLHMWLKKE